MPSLVLSDPLSPAISAATAATAATTTGSNDIHTAAVASPTSASARVLDTKVHVGNTPIDATALGLKGIPFPNTQVLVRTEMVGRRWYGN